MYRHRLIIALLLANVTVLALWITSLSRAPQSVTPLQSSSIAGRDPETRIRFPGAVPNLEEQRPFCGPAPTSDTTTWRLIDPAYVLGALVEMDSRAGLELSAQQARQCVEWTKLLRSSEADINDAECLFTQIVPHTLTTAQNRSVALQIASLERKSVDLQTLVSGVQALAARAPTAQPSSFKPSPRPAPANVGMYLAAVEMLAKPGADALTPAQAATLIRPLRRVIGTTAARASNYERLCAILTAPQARELAQILADVQAGRLDASTVFQPSLEVQIWLQKRAAL